MSQKRKLEEYHDPDYPQSHQNKRQCNRPLPPEQRIEKIRSIISREFQNELSMKEQEVMEIENRLFLAKKLLHRVRYAVVADYYGKQELDITVNEPTLNPYAEVQDQSKGVQKPIHPALKSLLGKKPADYDEILKIRPPREAAKTAKTSIKEKLMTKKEEKRLQRERNRTIPKDNSESFNESKKIPRHIGPVKVDKPLPQLNSSRRRNQTKHLVVVGNTSKYIGDENKSETDRVTHKWLIYVQTKTTIPIEKIVNKVRFFLHPSYRPNDIVDVSSPPFHLSRRGWGEFPVRIQIFFDPKLQQKPVQLVHNLVLDKTLSGLQTMGAETLVEIWLCSDYLTPSSTETKTNSTERVKTEEPETTESSVLNDLEENLLDFLNTIEKQNPSICQEGDEIEPTITCSPIIDSGIIPPDKTPLSPILSAVNKNRPVATSDGPKLFPISPVPSAISKNSNLDVISTEVKSANVTSSENYAGMIHHFNSDIGAEQTIQNTADNTTSALENNSLIANPPKVFQRKLVKCIDKQGNVKYIPMLVSANPSRNVQNDQQNGQDSNQIGQVPMQQIGQFTLQQSGQIKTPTNGSVAIQGKEPVSVNKNFIITKLNGQNNPIALNQTAVLKVVSSTANISCNNKLTTAQTVHPVKFIQNNRNKIIIVNKNDSNRMQDGNGLGSQKLDEVNVINHNSEGDKKIFEQPLNNALSSKCLINVRGTEQPKSSTAPFINSKNIAKKQVFTRDGKMYIIDPLQSKIKQQSKKQESLLKPQVSLLKPIMKNDNLANCIRNNSNQVFNHTALATDHDYTCLVASRPSASNTVVINRPLSVLAQRSSIVTVSSPNNSSMNVIVTQNKPITTTFGSKTLTPKPVLMQKPRRNYAAELEDKFLNMHFIGVRHAAEYLLRQLPVINNLAMNSDYRISYPFVVSSEKIFTSLITPKQKSYEWLRSKYISQQLQKHGDVKSLEPWTTREIVLFARRHAYSPVITYSKNSVKKDFKTANKTLKDLVTREIKREKINFCTVTSVEDVYGWINSVRDKIKSSLNYSEEVINIEDSDSEEEIRLRNCSKISPIKNVNSKYWLSVRSSLEKECSLITEKCQDIGIRLQPEEIIPGVMHSSAQIVLAQSLRSFIEDLVRRSLCKKTKLEVTTCIAEPSLQLDDIKGAILSRPQFDFLTNKCLGVVKAKEENAASH